MKLTLIPDEISHDPFTAIELGLRLGLDQFEIRNAYRWRLPLCPGWAVDKTVAAVKEYGVKVSGISPGIFKPVMRVEGSYIPVGTDTPEEVERHLTVHLPACFAFAERLQTRKITVFALGRQAGAGGEIPSIVIDSLGRAAEAAGRAGVVLLLENLAGTWADSTRSTLAILKAVNSGNLRLTWDPANVVYAQVGEDPVVGGYQQLCGYVENVHVKDVALTGGKPHWVMLGDGVVNWAGQLNMLKQDSYSGPLTLEPHLQYVTPRNLVAQIEEFVRRSRELARVALQK